MDDQAQARILSPIYKASLKHTTSRRLAINACSNIREGIFLQQHNNLIRHSSELKCGR
jgi:hypothetical protein